MEKPTLFKCFRCRTSLPFDLFTLEHVGLSNIFYKFEHSNDFYF